MTDPATSTVAAPVESTRAPYSPDYWDIVFVQIQKRPAAWVSGVLLVLLYAVAIFAPFIASDRPIHFKGVDRSAYAKAQRELTIAVGSMATSLGEVSGDELTATIRRDVGAVELRVATMRRQLAPTDHVLLDELTSTVTEIQRKTESGDIDGAVQEVASARTLATRATQEMRAADTGVAPVPGQTVALVPFTERPIIGNLGRGDVFFMVLWILVLSFPLWNALVNRLMLGNDRFRMRNARKAKTLAMVLIPCLAALVWQGSAAAFFVGTYKEGITLGRIVPDTVVFAPVPYGLAESSDESFRPPTWHRNAEIDEDGYYLNGPRAGRVDEATGFPMQGKPVIVRAGEPGRNAPGRHLLGTDSLGRDLMARMVWGARVSLAVGLVSTVLLVFIGTIVGALAGYYGGWVDTLFSRIIEIVQTFPFFFLVLIVVAFVGPSILNIMVIIGLLRWTGVARLVRGEFIRLRNQDFVVASEALGVPTSRTIFRHVLPNAMGPVLVSATFSVASGILTESALSFLGFGVQLPIPSWGALLIESRSAEHWWIQVYPGLMIFVTVMLYNLLGEGVRDALDPRLKVTR